MNALWMWSVLTLVAVSLLGNITGLPSHVDHEGDDDDIEVEPEHTLRRHHAETAGNASTDDRKHDHWHHGDKMTTNSTKHRHRHHEDQETGGANKKHHSADKKPEESRNDNKKPDHNAEDSRDDSKKRGRPSHHSEKKLEDSRDENKKPDHGNSEDTDDLPDAVKHHTAEDSKDDNKKSHHNNEGKDAKHSKGEQYPKPFHRHREHEPGGSHYDPSNPIFITTLYRPKPGEIE